MFKYFKVIVHYRKLHDLNNNYLNREVIIISFKVKRLSKTDKKKKIPL